MARILIKISTKESKRSLLVITLVTQLHFAVVEFPPWACVNWKNIQVFIFLHIYRVVHLCLVYMLYH